APTEKDLDELRLLSSDCRQLGAGLSRTEGDLFAGAAAFVSAGWRPEASVCEFWFDPHVVEELAELRLRISRLKETARLIAQVVFSSIIVTVSRQDSDTRYVRRQKNIAPGETVQRFCRGLDLAIVSTGEVSDILEPRFSCRVANSDILAAPDMPNIDLVVSSPP